MLWGRNPEFSIEGHPHLHVGVVRQLPADGVRRIWKKMDLPLASGRPRFTQRPHVPDVVRRENCMISRGHNQLILQGKLQSIGNVIGWRVELCEQYFGSLIPQRRADPPLELERQERIRQSEKNSSDDQPEYDHPHIDYVHDPTLRR